jgi:hypothetical protein
MEVTASINIVTKRAEIRRNKMRKDALTFEQHIPPLAQYLPRHGSQHVIDRHHQSWLKALPCKRALSRRPANWFEAHIDIKFSTVKKKKYT